MPDWPVFAGVTVLVTVGFVLLARASGRMVVAVLDARDDPTTPTPPTARRLTSTRVVASNVIASHGLLALLLLGTMWYTAVPAAALGIAAPTLEGTAFGAGLGIGLAAANAAGVRAAERAGFEADERLRTLLAPESAVGWAGLLLVVLPVVAVAEELLFRGALIGGLSAGYGGSLLALAVGSSVLFGLGHGLQGRGGVVVTTGLGGALAAAFVLTGRLEVVVVAHYVVNALELVVNEGLSLGGRPGR